MNSKLRRLSLALFVVCGLAWSGVMAQEVVDDAGEIAPPSTEPTSDMITTVVAIEGTAMTRPTPDDAWVALAVDDSLAVGADIRTGLRGRVRLSVGPNAEVVIERLSHLTIGQLDHDADTQTIRTMLAVKHGKVDFHVKHVGFINDFRITSPTDVVAVRGTRGSFSAYEGPAEIKGHPSNRPRAIAGQSRNTDESFDLSGDQSVDDETRDPHEHQDNRSDTTNKVAGTNRSGFGTRQLMNVNQTMQSKRGYEANHESRDRFLQNTREHPERYRFGDPYHGHKDYCGDQSAG